MQVISKITVGNLIKKGQEYFPEFIDHQQCIIDGIGWKIENFDIVQDEKPVFELDRTVFGIEIPVFSLDMENMPIRSDYQSTSDLDLLNAVIFTIYECDASQTPFDVIDRAKAIIKKFREQ